MIGTKQVQSYEQEVAGILMGFSLVFGLAVGVSFGLILTEILRS